MTQNLKLSVERCTINGHEGRAVKFTPTDEKTAFILGEWPEEDIDRAAKDLACVIDEELIARVLRGELTLPCGPTLADCREKFDNQDKFGAEKPLPKGGD